MPDSDYGDFVPGQDYVSPGEEGGYDVYVGGEFRGNDPSRSGAEGLYNSFFPPQVPTPTVPGKPSPGAKPSPGGYPSAIMDPQTQMAIAKMNAEIQQRQIDYQYARMNLIEARAQGTAEAAQKAQQAYQEALVGLQTTQQSQKQLMDWVGTQLDIWKQQNVVASETGAKTGLYTPPAYNPTLPGKYYQESGLTSPTEGGPGDVGGSGSLDAAGKIYDWAEAYKKAVGHAASPADFEARWGDVGKKFAETVISRNRWPSREEVLLDPGYLKGNSAPTASTTPPSTTPPSPPPTSRRGIEPPSWTWGTGDDPLLPPTPPPTEPKPPKPPSPPAGGGSGLFHQDDPYERQILH